MLFRSSYIKSRDESQPLQLPGVFHPAGDKVDPCCLDAGVPQHIRQPGHIPAGPVEGPGKEMPQIVREYLGLLHPRLGADAFHLRPYLPPAQTLSASGEEYLPGGDLLFSGVF